jgi:phage shock protein A
MPTLAELEMQKELEALRSAYRERAVKAVGEQNGLKSKINTAEYQIRCINEKFERAKERDNTDQYVYLFLIQEKKECEKEISEIQPHLQVAIALVEEIEKEIHGKRNAIRERGTRSSHPNRK